MERNRGYINRTSSGYIGKINIENVVLDIVCSFWSNEIPNFIWMQRIKEKRFDENTKSFSDYIPKPFFECYAYKEKEKESRRFIYKGSFFFVGYKYEMTCWWEDKTEQQLNLLIKRSDTQPLLERLNELKKINQKK